MADHSMLDMGSCVQNSEGIEENTASQKISVMDHLNGIQYITKKSDNFIIDMESFSSHGGSSSNNKQIINGNSRITLQRNLSRKGSLRGGGGGGSGSSSGSGGSDTAMSASSSPRGSNMTEKTSLMGAVPVDHSMNPQVHHQITINTGTSNINVSAERRLALRGNSFKRPPSSWAIDPKRVLLFFATLSSMGSILLIYFTLSIAKFGNEDSGPG
ncbi:uncharacterized protein [Euphorbia lathyris]|uniref:uncharacterized protein n=1 Tax=Euphorbia lathyris TaxID=212925 RepID=UPI00331382BD